MFKSDQKTWLLVQAYRSASENFANSFNLPQQIAIA